MVHWYALVLIRTNIFVFFVAVFVRVIVLISKVFIPPGSASSFEVRIPWKLDDFLRLKLCTVPYRKCFYSDGLYFLEQHELAVNYHRLRKIHQINII